jgi:tight adherence protein B
VERAPAHRLAALAGRIVSVLGSDRSRGGVAIPAMSAAIGLVLFGPTGAVLAVVCSSAGSMAFVRRRRRAKRELAEDDLAGAVGSIAAGLRAGLSLTRAIRFAADESGPSLAPSLRGVVDRTTLGMSLERSLDAWCEELQGRDARLVAGVVALHRRSGGDLPSVLDRLGETLRERRSATREVRSLTAQARLSGAILGLLPVAFFAFIAITSRRDLEAALSAPVGRTAIVMGLGMEAVAFVWIRRLLRVG